MVNEKILLAKEALIEQTDRPVTIDSTWIDLNLDSLDMFDTVLYIEDRIGREIDNKVVEKYYDRDLTDVNELYDFIKQWNEKQSAMSYMVDYKTVVLLDE